MEFDIMLEGKSKDISLLKLRPDLLRCAPDIAARFGVYPEEAAALKAEEGALEMDHSPANDPDVDVPSGDGGAAERARKSQFLDDVYSVLSEMKHVPSPPLPTAPPKRPPPVCAKK
ncbi:hypothetical protein [Acidisphaera sp. L21]|uniref:hypothetical protein n=1 Tax=Acidisphaera sp. L21 TaxID=1641851 RepID=UPI0020B10FB5|nr:hypothetical protein [Acidisphaera sp. L21]